MYANNIEQLYSFFIFTILGLLIGIIFDIFRILRKTFKTTDILTYIEDILFWFITGILTLAFIFKFNNGELRFYIFIGISIGSIIYMLFISNFFIKINILIFNIIKTFIYKIIHFLTIPFIFIFSLLKKVFIKPIYFVCINFSKYITKLINKIKNIKILNKKFNKEEGI